MKITNENNPVLFQQLLKADTFTESNREHRRGSSFYITEIRKIEEWEYKWFYESDAFVWDDDYGSDDTISSFTKVEQVERTIVVKEWKPVITNL